MKNRLIIAALAIGALAGCTKESSTAGISGDSAVQFTSATIATRTAEIEVDGSMVDGWESGDRIGISTTGMEGNFTNIEYLATDTASETAFDPADSSNTIYYPNSQKSDITFYAYYPYSDESMYTTVDVSKQKDDLGSVDFMTSNTTWKYGEDDSETPIAFVFDHKLSKVVLKLYLNEEVVLDEQVEENNTLSATILNVVKSKTYSITTGAEHDDGVADELTDIALTSDIDASNSSATVTAILHPSDIDSAVEFLINGEKYTLALAETLESGKSYTYYVTVGREWVKVGYSSVQDWDLNTDASDIYGFENNGDGSRNNPYQIYSHDELLKIGTGEWYGDSHYILMNNITLDDFCTESLLSSFKMSDGSTSDQFSGTFDGNGYTITNPTNSEGEFSGKSTFAIFDTIGSLGKVFDLNVNIEETYFSDTDTDSLPVITAITAVNYGIVENCSCEGSIKMSNDPYRYGIFLVGTNYNSVIECSNNATFISTDDNSIYDDLDVINDNKIFS